MFGPDELRLGSFGCITRAFGRWIFTKEIDVFDDLT